MARSSYPLLFERSIKGHRGSDLPALDVPMMENIIPENMKGDVLPLPELAEVDIARHYTNLSRRNFGVDNGFYPLGSCTMKYNPKINEEMPGLFADMHPLMDEDMAQGALKLMYDLDKSLCAITGMDKFTLQPSAEIGRASCRERVFRAV